MKYGVRPSGSFLITRTHIPSFEWIDRLPSKAAEIAAESVGLGIGDMALLIHDPDGRCRTFGHFLDFRNELLAAWAAFLMWRLVIRRKVLAAWSLFS